jgi:hypothetical protein
MLYILDEYYNSIHCDDTDMWRTWMSDMNNRLVKQEEIDKVLICTIFLGIDHNYLNSGYPLLFETMLFDPGFSLDIYHGRCSTWSGALKMHAAAVNEARRLQEMHVRL